MKTIIEDYIVIVDSDEISKEDFEAYQDKVYEDFQDLIQELQIMELFTYTIPEFTSFLNEMDGFGGHWVIRVKLKRPEPRFNVLDFDETVVKSNLNQAGVDRYLQGKDKTMYLLEEL